MIELIKFLLALVSSIAKYAADKQLMDAGAAQSILKGINDANDAINRANDARLHVDELPISKDSSNRDNQ